MVDQVRGAGAASQYDKQMQRAQQAKSERSFADVARTKRKPKKEKADGAKEGERAERAKRGEQGPALQERMGGEFAARLQASLGKEGGEAEGEAELGAGMGEGEGEGDGLGLKGDGMRSLLQGGADKAGAKAPPPEANLEKVGEQLGAEELEASTEQSEALEGELEQNLFASDISNQLMAQRATEPQAVAEAQKTPQIPQQVVDKVVENARFGVNADGSHEFQVDLKQDVFGGAELKILTKDGRVTVQMVSDDPNLHGAAEQLAEQLKAKGINIDQVEVLTQAEAREQMEQSRSGQQGGGQKQPGGGAEAVSGGGAAGGAEGKQGWSEQDSYVG